jgi:hypothetical protein
MEALRAALARTGDPAGRPVRALYDGAALISVADFDEAGADVDTPDDLRAAQERLHAVYELHPLSRDGAAATGAVDPEDVLSAATALPATPLAWPGLELHAPS